METRRMAGGEKGRNRNLRSSFFSKGRGEMQFLRVFRTPVLFTRRTGKNPFLEWVKNLLLTLNRKGFCKSPEMFMWEKIFSKTFSF